MAPLRTTILGSLIAVSVSNVLEETFGTPACSAVKAQTMKTEADFEACQVEEIGGKRRLSEEFLGRRRNLSKDFGRRLAKGCGICGDMAVDSKATYMDPNTGKETRCVDAAGYCKMADCGECDDLAGFFVYQTTCCLGGGSTMTLGGGDDDKGDSCDLCKGAGMDREHEFWHPDLQAMMSCGDAQDTCGVNNGEACGGCEGAQGWFSETTPECCEGERQDLSGGDSCDLCKGVGMDREHEFWHPDLQAMMSCGDAQNMCGVNNGEACGGCEGAQGWISYNTACCEGSKEVDEKAADLFSGGDTGGAGAGLGGLAAMTQTSDGNTDSPLATMACDQHKAAIACWEGDCCTDEKKDEISDAWESWKDAFELMDGQTMPTCEIKCGGKSSDAPRAAAPTAFGVAAMLALSATAM